MMDILALRIRVTDADAAELLRQVPPDELPVEGVAVRFTQDGVNVSGCHRVMFMPVSFETTWKLQVSGGRLEAKLDSLRLAGIPAGQFRRLLMRLIQETIERHPGVTLEEDTVCVDPVKVLHSRGLDIHITLKTVICEQGGLTVEAG
jgi:hypothetical protein